MPNSNNPSGFMPYTNASNGGGEPTIEYFDLTVANAAIGKGDPVEWVSGLVNRANAASALCGIAAESKAASSGGKIAVWADPDQRFVAQTDDGTGVLTAVEGIGLNADFVEGTPSSGRSTAEIDESSGATTATLPFKILRLSEEVGNAYGEFNRMVVKINNHQFGSGTGTAGT